MTTNSGRMFLDTAEEGRADYRDFASALRIAREIVWPANGWTWVDRAWGCPGSWDYVRGRERCAGAVEHRRALAFELRRRGWTYEEIGRTLGRHHSSVMHLVNGGKKKGED
jgi:hypothetical protein